MATFPLCDGYLRGIPRGIDGFADYQQKASVYREFMEALQDRSILERLPPSLAPLAKEPLLPSSWVSEVRFTALVLAIADLARWNEAAFVAHWYEVNRRVLSSRLYRVMFALASPSLALHGAETRWAQLHRGIKLHFDRSKQPIAVDMTYPANLVPRILAQGYTTAFRAVIELSGGHDVAVSLEAYEPTRAAFFLRWA